ncbi:hypothetical protein EIP86_002210 [Pleurotus ostreatoroseus]|nr:hypothetical protein EIP86_002210 [Pleurotus ostreatoroseus]
MSDSLKDIVTRMGTELGNSTLGWDVVVSYKQSEINALLGESYHNDPQSHVKSLNIKAVGYDQDLNPFDINFHFELAAPRVKYNSSHATQRAAGLPKRTLMRAFTVLARSERQSQKDK